MGTWRRHWGDRGGEEGIDLLHKTNDPGQMSSLTGILTFYFTLKPHLIICEMEWSGEARKLITVCIWEPIDSNLLIHGL